MRVYVTEFRRPNGAQHHHSVEVPDDCQANYYALRRCECRLTAELLVGGMVSQCVEHADGDFLMELTPCGKGVEDALVKMIREFDYAKFEEWHKAVTK